VARNLVVSRNYGQGWQVLRLPWVGPALWHMRLTPCSPDTMRGPPALLLLGALGTVACFPAESSPAEELSREKR
jgi:hypothetical protein